MAASIIIRPFQTTDGYCRTKLLPREGDNVTEHPRRKYAAKYPALYDFLVTVLSNQHEKDWLGSAVAEYIVNVDKAGLASTLIELSAAAEDDEVLPEEIGQLTNYALGSHDEMLDFLQELGKRLIAAQKA